MQIGTKEISITSSSTSASSYSDPVVKGTAKFTASAYDVGESGKFERQFQHSVEVEAVFDPETKTWTARIVNQWEGRF